MKLLNDSVITVSKKIINKLTTRSKSPDERRAPHIISSPFCIPHAHKTSSRPHLYILTKTTAEGAIRKVTLTQRDDKGEIIAPGDATGFIVCKCPNAADSSQHNHARLVPNSPSGPPRLAKGEHFVKSPIIFPNANADAAMEGGSSLLVMLPEGTKAAEEINRDEVLDGLFTALRGFGSTNISDQEYSQLLSKKALGIGHEPTAPELIGAEQQAEVSEHRADLSKQWRKAYTDKRQRSTSPMFNMTRKPSTRSMTYESTNEYLEVGHQPMILVWSTDDHLAMALSKAFYEWDRNIRINLSQVQPQHMGLTITKEGSEAVVRGIETMDHMSEMTRQVDRYRQGYEELGNIRVATLKDTAPAWAWTRQNDRSEGSGSESGIIARLPEEAYTLLQMFVLAQSSSSSATPTSRRSGQSETETEDDMNKWEEIDNQADIAAMRSRGPNYGKRRGRAERKRESRGHKFHPCPVCQAMFADTEAVLKHMMDAHVQIGKSEEKEKPKENEKMGSIMKASQYNDEYVQVTLKDDQMANFFGLTATTRPDPITHCRETRYVAPRFPQSIHDVEKLVAFQNIPQKELEVWFEAFKQVTQAKQLGSYRQYTTHNLGIENTASSLVINGKKDILNTLKQQAPKMNPQRIAELNTHIVTRFFHNTRVYCLQNRVEWVSWAQICINPSTIGQEVHDRILSRLNAHPTAIDVLSTVSSYIEDTVKQLLPQPVPFHQRRQEIIEIHSSQLNSAIPSIDYTRQRLDADCEELKYLHPQYQEHNQNAVASQMLQEIITTGVLHQIIAESPFERRLQHLYMADPKYQDIKAVEKAKLLEDIAKLIALDLHTNTNQAHKENWVGPTAMRTSFGRSSKQPTRCKAFQALNVTCSDDHCKLHQPTITQSQALTMRRSGKEPAVMKWNCRGCNQALSAMRPNSKSRSRSPQTYKRNRSKTRRESPRGKQGGKETNETQRSARNSRSRSRDRQKEKSPQPRTRTILTNPDRQAGNKPTQVQVHQISERNPENSRQKMEGESKQDPNHPSDNKEEANSGYRRGPTRPVWNYAEFKSHDTQASPARERRTWQQRSRSPTPSRSTFRSRDNYRQDYSRSKSPYNRRNSPYTRQRSQSADRWGNRNWSRERYTESPNRSSQNNKPRESQPQ